MGDSKHFYYNPYHMLYLEPHKTGFAELKQSPEKRKHTLSKKAPYCRMKKLQ